MLPTFACRHLHLWASVCCQVSAVVAVDHREELRGDLAAQEVRCRNCSTAQVPEVGNPGLEDLVDQPILGGERMGTAVAWDQEDHPAHPKVREMVVACAYWVRSQGLRAYQADHQAGLRVDLRVVLQADRPADLAGKAAVEPHLLVERGPGDGYISTPERIHLLQTWVMENPMIRRKATEISTWGCLRNSVNFEFTSEIFHHGGSRQKPECSR